MKILAIDPGDARIGLALSDDLGLLAHPLETIDVRKTKEPAARIATLVIERKVTTVVIGLPRNMDGTYGPAAEKTRAFADILRPLLTDCPIIFWDERLTTVAAHRALRESGRNAKNSRDVVDQVAAQMILQGYLDSQAL